MERESFEEFKETFYKLTKKYVRSYAELSSVSDSLKTATELHEALWKDSVLHFLVWVALRGATTTSKDERDEFNKWLAEDHGFYQPVDFLLLVLTATQAIIRQPQKEVQTELSEAYEFYRNACLAEVNRK